MAYIVRIDSPKDKPSKNTHGWQVRSSGKRGYHSKLFSDKQYGSKDEALTAAQAYLDQLRQNNPAERPEAIRERTTYPFGFHTGKKWRNNKSGVNGVFRTHHYGRWDTKKKHKLYYWGAFYSINRYGQRQTRGHEKFYVDHWGEEEARRRAIEFRQMWEEAAKEGVEAVKRFFEDYREGWLT